MSSSPEKERSWGQNAKVIASYCHPSTWAALLGSSNNSGNDVPFSEHGLPRSPVSVFTFLSHGAPGPASAPVLPVPGLWLALQSQVPELAVVALPLTGSASI